MSRANPAKALNEFGQVTSATTVTSVFGLATPCELMQPTTTEMGGYSDDCGARGAEIQSLRKGLAEP